MRELGYVLRKEPFYSKFKSLRTLDLKKDLEKSLENMLLVDDLNGNQKNLNKKLSKINSIETSLIDNNSVIINNKTTTENENSNNTLELRKFDSVNESINGSNFYNTKNSIISPTSKVHSKISEKKQILYADNIYNYLVKRQSFIDQHNANTHNNNKNKNTYIEHKVSILESIQRDSVSSKLLMLHVNNNSISNKQLKFNKDKIFSFVKKIQEQKDKDKFYLVNEHDKDYLRDLRKNIQSLKEFIISDICDSENLVSEMILDINKDFKSRLIHSCVENQNNSDERETGNNVGNQLNKLCSDGIDLKYRQQFHQGLIYNKENSIINDSNEDLRVDNNHFNHDNSDKIFIKEENHNNHLENADHLLFDGKNTTQKGKNGRVSVDDKENGNRNEHNYNYISSINNQDSLSKYKSTKNNKMEID